ncbi:MAG TPA: glycosyltransferase family 1 protein [Chthoniobacterales bacterium]
MKVVIDSRYVRERPSGIGTYVRGLIDRLPLPAPEHHFHLWAHRLAQRPLSEVHNFSEQTVSAEPNSLGTVLWPTLLGPLKDADLFHAPHNILGWGIPCAAVVTIHDLMWLDSPELIYWRTRLPKQFFIPASIRHALARATRIITGSRASADAIARIAPSARSRVSLIPYGVESCFAPAVDREAALAQATRILGAEADYFLVVGQNAPSKGHRLALEAFAAASRKHERLVLVQRCQPGEGLHALAQTLGVLERVLWLPSLPLEELITLMQAAIALVQPSLAEGFGLPVLEAMACGCPVIASDIPPLREVLAGAGRHFSLQEPQALARAIRQVADTPEVREEMRQRGLERTKAFSWDKCAAATLEVYREAAGTGPLSKATL